MARPISKVAPGWWDYTTLDAEIVRDAARLTPEDLLRLSRPGFQVHFYDTLAEFYLAEALEYIEAWQQSTPDNPAGICGPIGPTEQLPLVARIVNSLGLKLHDAHFWGMDEWVEDGKAGAHHPPALLRQSRHGALLQSHRPGAAHARGEPALPHRRPGRLQPKLRPASAACSCRAARAT